ncbi:hypothetical protein [Amycolatopsis magusensis]|uniref:Uncharacterized protein n=1 Tax=Amycolatopsis magusensis TaxID=882444 RepID=A0ABS4Q1F3_9PSEU|nr:hypothetical protein [Amycolatopsis magusensis]MBP2185515.1 hypothetical protein [Amycolatopsis magusensis]
MSGRLQSSELLFDEHLGGTQAGHHGARCFLLSLTQIRRRRRKGVAGRVSLVALGQQCSPHPKP